MKTKFKDFYYDKKNPKCKEMELNEQGYPIYKDSKRSVHRRIAKAYIYDKNRSKYPLPFKSYECHHADGDKLNFNFKNLILLPSEDHWKISKRLHKERNLKVANSLIFAFMLIVFILYFNSVGEVWNIYLILLLILILGGMIASTYENITSKIVKKTKLYKVIHVGEE